MGVFFAVKKDFVVDLASQAQKIVQHVKGWDKVAVLDWLSQYEEVSKSGPNSYLFRSPAGVSTGFMLDDGGSLTIINDHSTTTYSCTSCSFAE